jgi:hypothetical protein
VYSYVRNIRAAYQLPSPSELPAILEDPGNYLPKNVLKADLCVASGLHQDLLLDLPHYIQKSGIKGLIVPIEDFTEVPSGLKKQIFEKCHEFGIETAFPKPFCTLNTANDTPLISRFVTELKIGQPLLEIITSTKADRERIDSVIVRRSAPCGSTWYIAKKLIGVETTRDPLYDTVAKAHHSYPCTATMGIDPEVKEPILHIGGFLIREAIERALNQVK